MEEINAWGAYEAGTTQNARSLGRSTVRHRRATVDVIPPVNVRHSRATVDTAGHLPPTATFSRTASSHMLFFGTDDVATLKKTEEAPEDAEAVPKKEDDKQSKEWKDLCKLARDAFHVYFTDDSKTQLSIVSKIKQEKKKRIYTKINGTMPYLTLYLTKLQLPAPFVNVILFTEASFRGIAQVYFQNNPLSGLFILAGIFVQSTRVAVHGIISIVAGNLAGMLMGFDKSFLSCGLFGYNSFLVGLALATFYSPEKHEGYYWPVVVGTIIFAYFSSVLFVMLGKILSPYKTPPFTLPFNISTLLFLLAMGGMNNVDMAPIRPPELPSYESEPVASLTATAFFAGSIRGVGQVYLANDIVAGVLVLVGIMLSSRISALAAFLGSAIGAGVAALVGCNRDAIEGGMYGFNPSLTLTAMLMFYVPSIGSISIGIIASIITVFIQLALATSLEPCGLPFMTLPFSLATLAFIVIQGTTSNVISVPLSSMTTPEDHLARVSRLSNGFEFLFDAIRSSSYKGNDRRKNWLPQYKSGPKRMSTALSDYDEAVHGEREKGFFEQIFQRCKTGKDSRDERAGIMSKVSFAIRNSSYGDEEKDSYARMFNYINAGNEYEITKAQFRLYLQSVGLTDEVGLDFACEAFQLMDLDESGDIDVDEFFAFVQISKHMPEIRRRFVKFFDFVDVNGDRSVEISELDAARSYLGLPPLSEEDHASLGAICNEDEELEFEVSINCYHFSIIFKLCCQHVIWIFTCFSMSRSS